MGVSPGEESRSGGVAAQTIEAQLVLARSSHQEARCVRAEQPAGEDVAKLGRALQEGATVGRKGRNNGRQTTEWSAEIVLRANGLAVGCVGTSPEKATFRTSATNLLQRVDLRGLVR